MFKTHRIDKIVKNRQTKQMFDVSLADQAKNEQNLRLRTLRIRLDKPKF